MLRSSFGMPVVALVLLSWSGLSGASKGSHFVAVHVAGAGKPIESGSASRVTVGVSNSMRPGRETVGVVLMLLLLLLILLLTLLLLILLLLLFSCVVTAMLSPLVVGVVGPVRPETLSICEVFLWIGFERNIYI